MPNTIDLYSLKGRCRVLNVSAFTENAEDVPAMNPRGEFIMVQGLPELAELVRQGNSWWTALTTGLAAATALPTTTAGLSLWNGDVAGVEYVIDSFGSVEEVIDATQADETAICSCLNITPVTAPVNAALAIHSQSGLTYGGKARTVSGATVVNDGWDFHGTTAPLASAVAGANWKVNEVQLRGGKIVKSQGMFSVNAVKAGAAAAAQQFFFIRWHEVLLPAR